MDFQYFEPIFLVVHMLINMCRRLDNVVDSLLGLYQVKLMTFMKVQIQMNQMSILSFTGTNGMLNHVQLSFLQLQMARQIRFCYHSFNKTAYYVSSS